MMKKFTVMLLTLVMSMIMFTACGDAPAPADAPSLVGVWTAEESDAYVTRFNADGTGTHTREWAAGRGTSFSWSTSGGYIIWDYPGHPQMRTAYRLTGDVVYITATDEATGNAVTFRYLRTQ